MARKQTAEPSLKRLAIAAVVILATLAALKAGWFNGIGKLVVDYALNTTREELNRQQVEKQAK